MIFFLYSLLWLPKSSKSSLACYDFQILFNFLIFVTNVLLWFVSRNASSVLLVNVLLFFVISNLCSLLMSSYFCRSSFICCWCRHILDSWLSNFLWTYTISSSLSFRSAFKRVRSSFALLSSTSFLILWFCDFLIRRFNS